MNSKIEQRVSRVQPTGRALALLGGGLATGSAFANEAAVTAITGAQTSALAVAAALLAMGIAVWGGLYLYRKFFK